MARRDYQASLAADNAAASRRSRADRDIADGYPPPGDLVRRAACERDLRLFFESYFPAAFNMAWSDDHLEVIAYTEAVVLGGGLMALAMYRGGGKTTITVRSALWALLYRHRLFLSLLGATERRAGELLKHIKTELVFNERLAADFRQVCYPLIRLENNGRKVIGQLYRGKQTRIEWGADRLTFPSMPDDACDGPNVSGSTVSVASLTGALRGQSCTLPTGEIIRPDMVILDDPQTRESAMSLSQSAERAAIINGDVLGMAGPGKKIAAIMPCTVVRAGDMADTLLDRKRSPRWQGVKYRLLASLPSNERLWERYEKIRAESLEKGGTGAEATEFYRANREAMDKGAVASWPARHYPDELSAIQHAMNLKIDDPEVFAAEYQSEPLVADQGDGPRLTADQVAAKVNGLKRGVIPSGAEHLTAFVDVHDSLLYYSVCAWSPGFTGWVVDYSSYPDQHRRYYLLRKPSRTLASAFKGAGKEGAIRAGLDALTAALLSRTWEREDGAEMRIGKCLIDAGYVPDTVYDACRHSPHAALLMPSRGIGIGASSRPISEYDRTKGDRIGFNWFVPRPTGKQTLRHIRYDTNYWKSFVTARLAAALGDSGSLSLYGRTADEHRLIADHVTAEVPIRTTGQGRAVDEWRVLPNRPDNHFFDTLAGAAAAASLLGAAIPGTGTGPAAFKRNRVSFAELQERQRLKRK